MNEVFMEVPAVRNIAKSFKTMSQTLTQIAKVMEVLITVLRTTAFIGLVGGAAVLQYLETNKPKIDQQAAKFAELSGDLDASVSAYERGDQQGATRFH